MSGRISHHRTARGYERIIRCYIDPDIGRVSLAKLRTDQLDRFYSKLRDEGGQVGGPLSPTTVRQTHAVIGRALNQAMRWGWMLPPSVSGWQLAGAAVVGGGGGAVGPWANNEYIEMHLDGLAPQLAN